MTTPSEKKEINTDFNKSLGTVTKLLLDINLIESLKSLNDNFQKTKKLLQNTDGYFLERFDLIYDEKILQALKEANVDDTFITELLTRIRDESSIDLNVDLTNILESIKEFIKQEFKDNLFLEHSPHENYISLIGKNLDFIFGYAQDMHTTLELIKNSDLPNKEKMHNITFFSYARTTSTCVESASKEFIRSAYKICHLYILKKLIEHKDSNDSIHALFKKELSNAPSKGMGSVAIILERFFNFSSFISSDSTSSDLKKSFIIFKDFVENRNKIIHEDVIGVDEFNYIIKHYDICNNFLGDILNEYTLGDSQDTLVEDIMKLCSEIAQKHSNILEKLYPEAKAHIPF
ncbi:hypothetical protein LH408_19915 [Enterobacter cloacae]|uniref:hypothetical protein n=1 Tax=Enterobacter cloacae TaxID=550 RepID=UPI001D02F41A|nr:hypothetical protein [Enterobacter cloacae]UDG00287.1 hypothetical protein LH408_19915 [Enterobacter cloacae]